MWQFQYRHTLKANVHAGLLETTTKQDSKEQHRFHLTAIPLQYPNGNHMS
jgi:hypothetical protein